MKKLYAIIVMALAFALQAIPASAEPAYTKQAVERWIVAEVKASVSTDTIRRIINVVYAQARKHDIDPFLIITTIKTESRFRANAKSSAGAQGLMQVMPRWHRDKIAGRNIRNIETNIEVGTTILVDCLDKHNQNVNLALICYSGGAKNYELKLREGHNSLRRADVLYRFEKELPLNHAQAKFDKPFQYALPSEIPMMKVPEHLYAFK